MSVDRIPAELRVQDFFHHIDMGFLNRRLCMTALPPPLRSWYSEHARSGNDHMTVLSNDHLLVTMLLDLYQEIGVPTLLEALRIGSPRQTFRSTERLAPCPEIYTAKRVDHAVELDVDFGKPVRMAYHTEHLVSSTGTMTLAAGSKEGYVQSIVGVLHDRGDRYEIEPLVIGAPWLDHPRNGDACGTLMWHGRDFGEILPEDIHEFSKMTSVVVLSATEWLEAMRAIPESRIKSAFARPCLQND